MISAFGVDHGVSKSWKKLAPKLEAAAGKISVQGAGRKGAAKRHLYIAQRKALNEAGPEQAKRIHERMRRAGPAPVGMRGKMAEPTQFPKWRRLR
jgi:hypothetical protein